MFGIGRTELRTFLERSLSERERELLLATHDLQGLTFSAAVTKLASRYPESTAKAVLKRLKVFGFVRFGNAEHKGSPLVFTALGKTVFDVLRCDER